MSECELCKQGDPATTVRCHSCKEYFHLHKCQYDQAEDESVVLADCPSCGAPNCFQKRRGQILYSGPVYYWGQTILDLRE